MEKKTNEYKVTFEYLKNSKGEVPDRAPIEFIFQNHDDVFKIIDILSEKGLFEEKDKTAQFAIGLKLFGDILMRNRKNDLFSEMHPAFMAFMTKLKGEKVD